MYFYISLTLSLSLSWSGYLIHVPAYLLSLIYLFSVIILYILNLNKDNLDFKKYITLIL